MAASRFSINRHGPAEYHVIDGDTQVAQCLTDGMATLIAGLLESHTRPPSLVGREAELLAFIKQLSDALISVRPLGGSELFVKRFGSHYADPKFCTAAINQMRDDLHEARIAAVKAERAALSSTTAERGAVEGVHPAEKLWREHNLPEWFLGNGGTNTKLYAFYDAVRALSVSATDGGERCRCGVMCQELGRENGCRYARPELTTLRKLVDLTYQHATESEAVPSTDTADELIERALSGSPL